MPDRLTEDNLASHDKVVKATTGLKPSTKTEMATVGERKPGQGRRAEGKRAEALKKGCYTQMPGAVPEGL